VCTARRGFRARFYMCRCCRARARAHTAPCFRAPLLCNASRCFRARFDRSGEVAFRGAGTALMANALLQSLCFTTDATELGFSGAVRLPFEELAPCDGGRGGARHQSIVLTAHATCRTSKNMATCRTPGSVRNTRGRLTYTQCPGNRKTIDSTLPLLLSLRLSL
jgi:hypothetical protein